MDHDGKTTTTCTPKFTRKLRTNIENQAKLKENLLFS